MASSNAAAALDTPADSADPESANRISHTSAAAPQPLWTRSFIAGTLLNFFIAGNYFMLMVVMTAYALAVYQAPPAVAALCASAFIIGTLFSRFATAPMIECFGRVPLLVAGCAAEVALTALYLLNEPVGALIAVRLVHGFAYGLCSTTIATVVTSIVPAERKGEGIGYFMLSVTLGSAIGPFAGIFIANNFGYPTVFMVASVLVAAAIPAALLLRPPKQTQVRDDAKATEAEIDAASDAAAGAIAAAPAEEMREEAAADSLDSLVSSGRIDAVGDAGDAGGTDGTSTLSSSHSVDRSCDASGSDSSDDPDHAEASDSSNLPDSLSQSERCRIPSTHLEAKITDKVEHSPLARFIEASVLPISLVCGLLFFGYSSLLTFLTPYANQIGLARAASVFFVVYALAMFITRPFTGRAFDRKGPHLVMVPAFISFTCGMVMLAFVSNDIMLLITAALIGFGVGTVQSCGLAMAVRVTSDERLSVSNATFYMMLDIGVGIGPILLGAIAPMIGYGNLYLCMAAVGVAALALFFVVARTEKIR